MLIKAKRKIFFIILLLFIYNILWGQESDRVVYISKTGSEYHTGSCSYLGKPKIPVKLSEALSRGYGTCSRCRPLAQITLLTPLCPLHRVNVVNLQSYRQVDLKKTLEALVVDTIDGDTIQVRIQNPPVGISEVEKIRLIGADTPEMVHSNRGVENFGKEASNFTKRELLNKTVFLAFDWDLRDKYDRLLAYIYLPNGSCHNAKLIKQGFAHAYTQFPFQFLNEFRELERYAMENNLGLWKK